MSLEFCREFGCCRWGALYRRAPHDIGRIYCPRHARQNGFKPGATPAEADHSDYLQLIEAKDSEDASEPPPRRK